MNVISLDTVNIESSIAIDLGLLIFSVEPVTEAEQSLSVDVFT